MKVEWNKYAKSLLEQWHKAFGVDHKLTPTPAKHCLKNIVEIIIKMFI